MQFCRRLFLIGPTEPIPSPRRLKTVAFAVDVKSGGVRVTAFMRDPSRCQLARRSYSVTTPRKVHACTVCLCGAKRVLATFALLALASPFLGARTASAQVVLAIDSTAAPSSNEKPTSSFNLPTQSSSVTDAIQEFQRFVEHEAWEKAFQSLETITSKSTEAFIERPDHVLVPSRLLVQSVLAGIPPAGKRAFRVFYVAPATALW